MQHLKILISYGLVSTIIMVCLFAGALTVHAAEAGLDKKILLLNSYHSGYKGSDDIVRGFKETLRTSFPDAEIGIEYLDSKHFSGPEFDARVIDTLSFKYRKQPFDLIVSTDDYAFNVLEQHRNQLFGQTPVVFCGTNNFDKNRIKGRPDFVGIDETPSFTETLELMFSLHPGTKEVIAIHDDSVTGQLNSADFRERSARFESRAKISYRNGKRLEELVHEVGQLKPGTLVVYFASFVLDANGKRYSSVEALKLISKASRVPIYGGWEFSLGNGIVGGRLVDLREHGRAAAVLAAKVLQGESPSRLTPLQPSPNKFMFDYAELKRFAIPESGLPTGSEISNRPPTFFSLYGTALLSILSAGLLLLVVVIFVQLLASNKHLKQSRIKFSSMVDAFDGFMYVCSPEYRIEFMNEKMIKRTGYDATGEFCYKVLHGLDSVCSWCRNDQVFAGESIQWEIKSPKDERWYNISDTPLHNADGTVFKQAMITDITERKVAEDNLSEQKALFEAIFRCIPDAIVYANIDREVVGINSAFTSILGFDMSDLAGKKTSFFYESPEEYERQGRIRFNMTATEHALPYEVSYRRKDGSLFPGETLGTVVKDGCGTVIGYIGVIRDITGRKQAEEDKRILEHQMQHTQKLESLGVLSGGIAHDFNNILAIIIGYCGLIKMDYETAQKNIPEIEIAAERAAGLCRQMLAYAGKTQLIKTRVNMQMIVDEMVTMLKYTIPQNAAITTDLSVDIPPIIADASQLRQVMMNLIINASEAIGIEQGEILVLLTMKTVVASQSDKDYQGKAIPSGRYICLEITDNGCGMDEETKRRIFEPFYTTKFTGRGLGMSAVLGIINSHSGALQFFSQPGQGTTFKVYLPVPTSDIAGEENPIHTPSIPWQGSGTILLVEDEVLIRDIAKIMLETLGFTVLEAVNGKEALEVYQKSAADITLVLTDMGMPVMDGYALFPALKQLNPKLPIIISSGFGDADVTSKIGRDNIAGIISKPYNFDQFREILRGVLDVERQAQA